MKHTWSAGPVDRVLIADNIIGNVDANVTSNRVLVEIRHQFALVHLQMLVVLVQCCIGHEYATQEHADPQHINLQFKRNCLRFALEPCSKSI